MKKLLVISITVVFAGMATILHAEGSASAGKDKTSSCLGCHGDNGNSTAPNFPKLAQQHASYIATQLRAFKDGSRNDPMMSAIAGGLSEQDMADIGEFYAAKHVTPNGEPSLPPADEDEDKTPAQKSKLTMPELLAQGANLYRNGDLARGVSACIACHGANGEGNAPAAFPSLKSQHGDYLIKTLTDFKNGVRSTNPDNMMTMIAKKMTDDEIKAVSYHISAMK